MKIKIKHYHCNYSIAIFVHISHSVHWGIYPPPQKHHPPLSKPPLFRQSPLYMGFLQNGPQKLGFFHEPPKY